MEVKTPEKESEHTSEYIPEIREDGTLRLKERVRVERGKKGKSEGNQFEVRVRKDLEEKGWIIAKWPSNVDLENNKIVPAKKKWRFNGRTMVPSSEGTGFPDFIAFQEMSEGRYKIIGVESKINSSLSKEEKLKCEWYLKNKIFTDMLLAGKKKEKNRIRVEYTYLKEILERMR